MKSEKQGLVPRLRFPEFREAGEWKIKSLGEVCNVLQGYGFPTEMQGKFDGEYPFCKVSDVSKAVAENGGLLDDAANYIDKEELSKLRAKLIPVGSTVFAKIGEALRLNRRAYVSRECLIDNNVVGLKAADGAADDYFIYISSQLIDLNKHCGGAVPSVNKTTLEAVEIVIPNPDEQQKIADCLSSLDALITAQADKIDALKTHKRGLMQQLFPREGETIPRLRFPEFRDAGEWKRSPLGEIVGFMSGGTPSKDRADYWGGDIPWVSAASMHGISIDRSDRNITQNAVDDGARIIPKGTLLILVRGSMLHKRIPIGLTACKVAFNQDVKALRMKSDMSEEFLLHLLISNEARLLSAVSGTGIGAGKLDTNELEEFLICVPEMKEEQQRIASNLSSLDTLIATHTEKLEALKAHKKGLMQQLFPAVKGAV